MEHQPNLDPKPDFSRFPDEHLEGEEEQPNKSQNDPQEALGKYGKYLMERRPSLRRLYAWTCKVTTNKA